MFLKPASNGRIRKQDDVVSAMKIARTTSLRAGYSFSADQMQCRNSGSQVRSDIAVNFVRTSFAEGRSATIVQRIQFSRRVRRSPGSLSPHPGWRAAPATLDTADVLNTVESIGGKIVGRSAGNKRFALQCVSMAAPKGLDAIRTDGRR